MGEADGEGIGLVGRGVVAEAEHGPGHEGDLLLAGGAFSGGGFFDELGRVFVNGEAGPGGGEEGSPAGSPQDDSRAGVLDVDDQLDGKGRGGVVANQTLDFVVNFDQAGVGVAGGGVFDGSGGQDDRFLGGPLQHGETGGPERGVDGQDPHGGIVPTGEKMSREGRLTGKKREDKL